MDIYSAKFSQDKKFYVYEYLRAHKSKYGDIGSPYYVGKGTGSRAFSNDHTTKPPKDKNNIRVSSLMNEADAFQNEMFKIMLSGRIDLGTGCLRNRTDGGEGSSGAIRTQDTIRKCVEVRKRNNSYKRTKEADKKANATKFKNGTHRRSKDSLIKQINTRREKGNLNTCTLESRRKSVETRKANGTLGRTKESIAKGLATRISKYGPFAKPKFELYLPCIL